MREFRIYTLYARHTTVVRSEIRDLACPSSLVRPWPHGKPIIDTAIGNLAKILHANLASFEFRMSLTSEIEIIVVLTLLCKCVLYSIRGTVGELPMQCAPSAPIPLQLAL